MKHGRRPNEPAAVVVAVEAGTAADAAVVVADAAAMVVAADVAEIAAIEEIAAIVGKQSTLQVARRLPPGGR